MSIKEYLEKNIQYLGIDNEVVIEIVEEEERLKIKIQVPQEHAALLIGNHGETLDALELLTKISFKDQHPDSRIILDVNDYRENNMLKLKEEALQAAEKVLENREAFEFRNLNSYERYQVHTAIAEDERFSDLTTFSEDRGRERILLLAPKDMVEEELIDREKEENSVANEQEEKKSAEKEDEDEKKNELEDEIDKDEDDEDDDDNDDDDDDEDEDDDDEDDDDDDKENN